jgi:putative transposase
VPQRWKVYEPLNAHFVTSTVIHLIPVFRREAYFRVLADSFTYCIQQRRFVIHAFVIMPDHFHLLCSQLDGDIPGVIRDIKRYTSRQLIDLLVRDHAYAPWLASMRNAARGASEAKLWDDEFHPEQVHSRSFYDQKCTYIHENPVRAGYVDNPCHWRYSSACLYYEDRDPVIEVKPVEW